MRSLGKRGVGLKSKVEVVAEMRTALLHSFRCFEGIKAFWIVGIVKMTYGTCAFWVYPTNLIDRVFFIVLHI